MVSGSGTVGGRATPQRSDSLKTQSLLLTTAERLFAERGIDAVSLSEINRAAGQRNKSALHYHFGSRDGVLKALLERHFDAVSHLRDALVAGRDPSHEPTLREAVAVIVLPLADHVADPDSGGIHYVGIMAQLAANPSTPIAVEIFTRQRSAIAAIAPTLSRHIPQAPPPLRARRAQLLNSSLFNALLVQAHATHSEADRAVYVNDLIDMLAGLLSAPIAPESQPEVDRFAERYEQRTAGASS